MSSYSHETYGERVAGVYDEMYSDLDPHAIDALADLAGTGPALELGIGTGRIALPLSGRNVNVHGLDAASSMISRLRAKPGGDRITVTPGSFADGQVDGDALGAAPRASLEHPRLREPRRAAETPESEDARLRGHEAHSVGTGRDRVNAPIALKTPVTETWGGASEPLLPTAAPERRRYDRARATGIR